MVSGTQGMFEAHTREKPDITLREIASTYLSGSDNNPMAGTAEQVADYMIHLLEEGGGDGFQITPSYYTPHYYRDIVDRLIPALVKKKAFRSEYEAGTLRDRMRR